VDEKLKHDVREWAKTCSGVTIEAVFGPDRVLICTTPAAYRAALEEGKIALSPLEVLALLGGQAGPQEMAEVCRWKKAFPGTRVEAVLITPATEPMP
jgi:hypothetical protein